MDIYTYSLCSFYSLIPRYEYLNTISKEQVLYKPDVSLNLQILIMSRVVQKQISVALNVFISTVNKKISVM